MEIVTISYLGSGQVYQDYQSLDQNLISINYITPNFGAQNDYVELFVYDEQTSLLSSNYLIRSYKPSQVDPKTNLYTAISIDPESDVKNEGFNRGKLNVQYNFLRKLFNSDINFQYWIKEISPSRTEIKLASQDISNIQIENGFNSYQVAISSRNYYNDFYLNFASNQLVLGVNAAYTEEGEDSYLLVKLYQPLPLEFDVKSTLWIVEKAAESVSYEVDIQVPVELQTNEFSLRGPNYNVKVNDSLGQTTPYYNYSSLLSSDISSSIQQLKSWYDDKAIEINVDYTNFENFIHFSSATERINNFVYKLGLIESYSDQIVNLRTYSGGSGTTIVTSGSIASLQNSINRVIEKFDLYEYYLYYSSESFAWPKYNAKKPYAQVSITSSQASNWLGSKNTIPTAGTSSLLFSASYYDAQNQNKLTNNIPTYLVEDDNNQPYFTFLDMVGQHFDNVWLYYKDVTNRYNSANNPNRGISKDQVADALRGLGMEIYTNSTISDSVYFSLFGYNPDGSLLPPTGSERITNVVTSSIETIASNEIEKEVYKRLYHNLPYLLKSRGTERGVKALISCFGIPENILSVKEYGGYNRYDRVGILDQYSNKINYFSSSVDISSSFLNPYSTLQYYSNDDYVNSTNLEVAFSPADVFNAHITASLPNLRLENVIGAPGYLLSSSYEQLDNIYEKYLRDNYVRRYNLWDYVRLVKYYNNSVFKMVKDYVPARANLATGIVIKDHVLHRNKYPRRELQATDRNNYTQSIDTAFVSAGPANELTESVSTSKSGYYTSSLGYVSFVTTDGVERYTGDFQGSTVTVTSLNSFNPQIEQSSCISALITQSLFALYHNVSQSLRSRRFLDLDYTYQQNVPVNLDLIRYVVSKSESENPQWDLLYSDPNVPFSYLQDYNYALNSFTIPRYFGSKVQSSKYTVYTEGESGSLGKTAAIDKEKYQFAYLVDIYTASLNLTGRSNSQIKYIIDNDQNVLDLTKANENVFFTQNIFKSGESVNVSLFNYDPRNPDVQYLTDKRNLQIYEGGWRYSPMGYSILGQSCTYYSIYPPIKLETTRTVSNPGYTRYVTSPYNSVTDMIVRSITKSVSPNGLPGVSVNIFRTNNTSVTEYVKVKVTDYTGYSEIGYILVTPPNGDASGLFFVQFDPDIGDPQPTVEFLSVDILESVAGTGNSTITEVTYLSSISDCDNGTSKGVYVPFPSTNDRGRGLLWLSVTQSLSTNYGTVVQTSSYANMETPVFPIFFQKGDMVKLKDQKSSFGAPTQLESNWWHESEEYRVVDTEIVFDSNNERRVQLVLDRPINASTVDNWNSTPIFPSPIKCYIFNKHVPDETNVILRYDPKSNITQDGLLYPEYLRDNERLEAGNTIKSLKSQNLI